VSKKIELDEETREKLAALKPPKPGPDTLREVADIIELAPHLYDQGDWGNPYDVDVNVQIDGYTCGSTHCIAGWVVALHGWRPRDMWEDETGTYGDWSSIQKGDEFSAPWHEAVGLLEMPNLNYSGEERSMLGSEQRTYDLFDGGWKPKDGLSVPDALRMLADGASIQEVSDGEFQADGCNCGECLAWRAEQCRE
jgi:hypothetical protein